MSVHVSIADLVLIVVYKMSSGATTVPVKIDHIEDKCISIKMSFASLTRDLIDHALKRLANVGFVVLTARIVSLSDKGKEFVESEELLKRLNEFEKQMRGEDKGKNK